MDRFVSADPLFAKALKTLSEEAQRNLTESGLSDPGVLDAFLRDPETELEELAREPEDCAKTGGCVGTAGRVRTPRAGPVCSLRKGKKGRDTLTRRTRAV